MFCTLFMVDNKVNPAAYKMLIILEDTSVVRPRMQAQARQKTTIPTALFRLIQKELNESFLKTLERR